MYDELFFHEEMIRRILHMMSSSSFPQIRLNCAEVVSWLLYSEDDSHTVKLLSLGLM